MQSGAQARSQSLPPWLVTSGRRRLASPPSRLQWAAAALAFVATAVVLSTGVYPSTSRWLLVPLAPALVLRRGRAYLRDFVPFAVLVLLYEWLRTEAHHLRPHAYYSPQLDFDKAIGL